MDTGERLANWLEGLGLAGALAEAGLPTFTRDADGRAVWTDPERLDELEALLRSEGEEPEHAVPVALVLIARQARLRSELLDTPWFTYETLAELRGATRGRHPVRRAQGRADAPAAGRPRRGPGGRAGVPADRRR